MVLWWFCCGYCIQYYYPYYCIRTLLAAIFRSFCNILRFSLLQAINGRNGQSLLNPKCIPTERIFYQLPLMWQQLYFRHCNVCAGYRVAASEVNWSVPHVVSSLDVPVQHLVHEHSWRLVPTILGQAVVLVNYDAVSNILHLYVLEQDVAYWSRPSLPCLYPHSIVWVSNHCIFYCYVGNTCLRIVDSQAPNAALFQNQTYNNWLLSVGLELNK